MDTSFWNRRRLTAPLASAFLLLGAGAGCSKSESKDEAPKRFAGVAKQAATAGAAKFCDKSFPADGTEAVTYKPAPTRPLEGAPAAPTTDGAWRWVNVWATWCTPCLEEMGLLGRWRDAFQKDGLKVAFELLSIDAPEAEPQLRKWLGRNLPGHVQWLRSEDDFGPWLEALQTDKGAAIPIHALVDPKGMLRCVRVGAVHEQDFGAVRSLISGGAGT